MAEPNEEESEEKQNFEVFENEFEEYMKSFKWPINEEEPGFPQTNKPDNDDDEDNPVLVKQEEPQKSINVTTGLAMFAMHRKIQKKAFILPKVNQLKDIFKELSKEQQKQFFGELKVEFPQLKEKIDPNLQRFNEFVDFMRQKLPNLMKIPQNPQNPPNPPNPPNPENDVNQENDEEEKSDKDNDKDNDNVKKSNKFTLRIDGRNILEILKRGIKNNTESEELRHLKTLMSGKSLPPPISKRMPSVLPSRGTAYLEDLNLKIVALLCKRFTFQGLLILSRISNKWSPIFSCLFFDYSLLWFSNENHNERRFLPIEDCCEECHHIINEEPVIRVNVNRLTSLIDSVLLNTRKLKCLRLYRFQIESILVFTKLKQNCPELQHLDLTESYGFTLFVIKEMCIHFSHLKHLILTATDLTEEMLDQILLNMGEILTLAIGGTYITGESFKKLPRTLKRLDIRCCPNLKTRTLINFLQFSGDIHLQHLKIDGYQNKEIYRKIWTFYKSSLLLLEVNDSPRDPFTVESYIFEIPLMSELQALKVGKNVIFEAKVFDNLVNSCPNIISFTMKFDVYDKYRFSENNLLQISIKWPKLEYLYLDKCQVLGINFMKSLQTLPKLKYLNLTESSELKDYYMSELLPKCVKLNFIVLDRCLNLGKRTLESVINMALKSSQLLKISMIGCNFQSIYYLKAKHQPNIQITYSSLFGKRYVSFNGERTQIGRLDKISDFLKEY